MSKPPSPLRGGIKGGGKPQAQNPKTFIVRSAFSARLEGRRLSASFATPHYDVELCFKIVPHSFNSSSSSSSTFNSDLSEKSKEISG
jgi:hypothetical protein